jgi:phage terminase large subunit
MTEAATDAIRAWRADPVKFVRDVFGVEPDEWQKDALACLGGEPNPSRRLCMKACTGPGKSAALAWIGWHRLACFAAPGEHPKGAALSITADNLKDNLWAELAKWQGRSRFLQRAFTWTKERIYAADHPETWFLSARSFAKDADSEAIGRALSGLHSQFPFILLDETGEMPVAVGKAAQQIFTGLPHDALIAQAGNPTSSTGLLYASCGSGTWNVVTITADPADPKRTPRVSVEHAQAMIDEHGRENPWVMATILGLFPPTGFTALLGIEEIERAMARHYRPEEYAGAPVVLGVDVARQGDDESVIARRQGVVAFPLEGMRIPDTMLVSARVSQAVGQHKADGLFVDESGGYGAGVVDDLRRRQYEVIGVQFGGKANDARYFDKRSEMLFELCKWVQERGALPNDPLLKQELLALRYVYQGDRFRVVPKDILKKELGRSPDRADGLGLTFAYPVQAKPRFPDGAVIQRADEHNYAAAESSGVYNPLS